MTQMTESLKKDAVSLPFFGIPRILPYVKKYRKTLLVMLIGGLVGTGLDIGLPLFQRYSSWPAAQPFLPAVEP